MAVLREMVAAEGSGMRGSRFTGQVVGQRPVSEPGLGFRVYNKIPQAFYSDTPWTLRASYGYV